MSFNRGRGRGRGNFTFYNKPAHGARVNHRDDYGAKGSVQNSQYNALEVVLGYRIVD